MSNPDELLDVDELEDGEAVWLQLAAIPCETAWCRAKRRKRRYQTKYSPGELVYPECGDRSGDFSGLVHFNRVERARAALQGSPEADDDA
jgi:hypothetical protein